MSKLVTACWSSGCWNRKVKRTTHNWKTDQLLLVVVAVVDVVIVTVVLVSRNICKRKRDLLDYLLPKKWRIPVNRIFPPLIDLFCVTRNPTKKK